MARYLAEITSSGKLVLTIEAEGTSELFRRDLRIPKEVWEEELRHGLIYTRDIGPRPDAHAQFVHVETSGAWCRYGESSKEHMFLLS